MRKQSVGVNLIISYLTWPMAKRLNILGLDIWVGKIKF